jgi:hypothetical protein
MAGLSSTVDSAVKSASPPAALTPIDVILDFKTIDQNHDGEISAVEFIDGLRSNRQLAAKYGLSDDILNENGTREKYEMAFGSIDYNHSDTVNVFLSQNKQPFVPLNPLLFSTSSWRIS